MLRSVIPEVAVRLLLLLILILLAGACARSRGATEQDGEEESQELTGAAAEGELLFQGEGRCATCHALTPGTVIVGPSLAGIARTAAERIPGVSAEEYLEESILVPDAYKVPGFEDQQMPDTLAKILTAEQLDALIAYLLTLD